MSPDWTMRADARRLPETRVIRSRFSCASAVGARRRIALFGIVWLYSQIWEAVVSPYSRAQRSTSHSGCARALASASGEDFSSVAGISGFRDVFESLRSTAFTKGAAEYLRARFTSSTLS